MPRETPFTFRFNSPAEALAALVGEIRAVGVETTTLDQARGRVLAQDVISDRPSPAVDLSSMDGYAVRLADLGVRVGGADHLMIAGEMRIGREPPVLSAGKCLRIVTGGAIPSGAEAVVKREDVTEKADRIEFDAALRGKVKVGENIRRAGENLAAGSIVVSKGTVVTPAVAAALAAFGVVRPTVFKPLTVAILTTGDEVIPPQESPTPYQLRDSNAAALKAMLGGLAFAEIMHAHVPDHAGVMNAAVGEALRSADALFLTGGVSMGHRDFVADGLAANGVRTIFHGLPQRPGKPILAGIAPDGRPVLALPGNPVSVMVTARRIGVPALLARSGIALPGDVPCVAHITNSDTKTIDLWWHRLVRFTGPGHAELIDARSSGDVVGAARADGFVEIPPKQSGPGPWPFYSWSL